MIRKNFEECLKEHSVTLNIINSIRSGIYMNNIASIIDFENAKITI